MKTDKPLGEIIKGSLIGLVATLVLGGLLLFLDYAGEVARGASPESILTSLSIGTRETLPWALVVGGFVAGLYLRTLLLKPIIVTSLLTNAYVLLLSLVFHVAVVRLTPFLLIVQTRAFLLGLVLFGVALSLGSLLEIQKERHGVRE